jgi:hypothetical protein
MTAQSHHSHEHVDDAPRNIWVEDSLWIEDRADGGLTICFGQFGARKETSPGHLDQLPLLSAWIGQGVKPARLPVWPETDGLRVFEATAGDHVQAEDTSVSVIHATGSPGRKPVLAARWWPTDATSADLEPRLTLDLIPLQALGKVRLFFRGVPLSGATVAVFGNDGTRLTELTSDAAGEIGFKADHDGRHHCICSHTERLPVCVGGHLYAGTRYWSTLTWRHTA